MRLATATVLALLVAGPVVAQTPNPSNPTTNPQATSNRDADDNDHSYGWIGLLGLIGLAGLLRRNRHPVNTGTTHPGTTARPL